MYWCLFIQIKVCQSNLPLTYDSSLPVLVLSSLYWNRTNEYGAMEYIQMFDQIRGKKGKYFVREKILCC